MYGAMPVARKYVRITDGGFNMMKRVCFVFCLLLVISLISCQKEQNCDDPVIPIYTDMESFLSEWHSGGASSGVAVMGDGNRGEETTLVVPVLKTSEYIFDEIAIYDYRIYYYYTPAAADESSYQPFDDDIIVTWVNKEGTFDILIDQYGLTAFNGQAYDQSINTWFLDRNGKCLKVEFPDNRPVTTIDELYSYMSFDEYTTSGNSGEVQ